MKAGKLPKRFLTRRDKTEKTSHHRGKSADAAHKHRPFSADAFFTIFRPTAKQAEKDQENNQDEPAKVEEVLKRLAELEMTNVREDHILFALHSQFAAGDVDKAVELMKLQKATFSGTIVPYNPNVPMLGAENRGMVTCYLDALLFAMFAKLEAFECMLTAEELPGEPQKRLAGLLRLWVNLLRSGKLIHTDMTELIQEALAECGWSDARFVEQQDTSEAFAFITETLQLPLLPLQVDLFHHGKNDEADHKVVYERLLNLAVPPDPDGKGINLEDCLEEYFNAQVDVHRDSFDDRKGGRREMTPTPTPQTPTAADAPLTPMSTRRWTAHPTPNLPTAQEPQSPTRPHRSRTESIIQRVVLDDKNKAAASETGGLFHRAKRSVSVVKAVTIPAWQFFRLIPWHSPANHEPQSDLEVARHFSQRPVVGICLKRYMVDEQGVPKRQNTYIDIPDSLRLPHFIVDDRHVEESGLSQEYKLVLQSVVCHRGDSLHSGHYISFCRVAPKLLTDNRRYDSDAPPDYEEAQWVKFDDLAVEDRISPVDDIKQSLKEEMPYLLLYQIVPIVDVTASSTDGTEAEPPSYDDSALQLKIPHGSERPVVSRQASSYFDNLSTLPSTSASIRFSSELERPSRRSFADDDGFLSVSRRGSCAVDTSLGPSPALTPLEGPSPIATPGEETTAQRLSRAAAKFRASGSKSRPQSQAGEGRISLTMSRLSGLVRASKEPLQDDFEIINANGSTTAESEKDEEESKEKDNPSRQHHHKRGRSKARLDRGKGKEKGKNGEVPDRECVIQ
ncbi:ubiquitin carboxyl-terminal hydrolase-domain-containing protein [Truncatella angustata]|uniref:ubiquitinyl hydrolase 1 n=1 Tax=Truncatella angustata TaxID=152316 RepID=A0A9P8ZWQ7_9PEZI|nr:ubiquitin carboxyl-terminal hydrolase-domain-containing protein [Truncatella angustata]KAH6652218.1 ubiquitin carboxyl-terminal hydrolase-domain-containing protein [Truncatella angustata]